MSNIYTVTVLNSNDVLSDIYASSWCVGWFESLREAQEALLDGGFYITECFYDTAIIEQSKSGVHGSSVIQNSYKADFENREWREVLLDSLPEKIQNSCNWNGIG